MSYMVNQNSIQSTLSACNNILKSFVIVETSYWYEFCKRNVWFR